MRTTKDRWPGRDAFRRWTAVGPALALLLAVIPATAAQAEPVKRALLVGISEYTEESGWGPLNTSLDLELMQEAYRRQGFPAEGILVLRDGEATREGILDAFETHLIGAGEGAVVAFHYSGHGYQIDDDDGDEIDGQDEVLVPVDARRDPGPGYPGDRHIRDDEISVLLDRLRRALGAEGSVLVSWDACHSGSLTRGQQKHRGWHGARSPIGSPAATASAARSRGAKDEVGGIAELDLSDAASAGLAPVAVISAARYDQDAGETTAEVAGGWGEPMGALSKALSGALIRARADDTYGSLFARVKATLAGLVPGQEPQIEGAANARLFSGEIVEQQPYHTVITGNDGGVMLDAGSLVGIGDGSRVVIMPVGTVSPQEGTPLATGRVEGARPTRAPLVLDQDPPEGLDGAWAFVTEVGYGEQVIRVAWDEESGEAPADTGERVADLVGKLLTLAWAEGPADLLLRWNEGEARADVVLAANGRVLDEWTECVDKPQPDRLECSLKEHSRNLYLRRIDLEQPSLQVRMEVVPVRATLGGKEKCVAQEHLDPVVDPGGNQRMGIDDTYILRFHHEGTEPAWVAVLGLFSDGTVGQIYPFVDDETQEPLPGTDELQPGKMWEFEDGCVQVCLPAGIDVLKLFATRDRVNFAPVLTKRTRSTRGFKHPLELLLSDTYPTTRGERSCDSIAAGSVSTTTVTLHIDE